VKEEPVTKDVRFHLYRIYTSLVGRAINCLMLATVNSST